MATNDYLDFLNLEKSILYFTRRSVVEKPFSGPQYHREVGIKKSKNGKV
jgi:hypothetical protein